MLSIYIKIFLSVFIFALLIFLSFYRDKYLHLLKKGWGFILWGIFFSFSASLLEILPDLGIFSDIVFGDLTFVPYIKIFLWIVSFFLLGTGLVKWLKIFADWKKNLARKEDLLKLSENFVLGESYSLIELLENCLNQVQKYLKTHSSAIWAWNPQAHQLVLATYQNFSREEAQELETLAEKENFLIDVITEKKSIFATKLYFLKNPQIKTALGIPVVGLQKSWGVLALFYPSSEKPGSEEISFLEQLCIKLGEQIANLRLSRELKKKTEALEKSIIENRIVSETSGYLVAELEEEKILERILWSGLKLIEASYGHIFLLENETLSVKASFDPSFIGLKFKIADFPLIQEAIRKRQSLSMAGDSLSTRRDFTEEDTPKAKASLVAPLLGKDKIWGAMVFENRESIRKFSEFEIQQVATLAHQASLVIQNFFWQNQFKQEMAKNTAHKHKWQTLLQAFPYPVTIHNSEQKIVFANRKAREDLKLTDAETSRHNCSLLLFKKNSPQDCICSSVFENKTSLFKEFKLDELTYEVFAFPDVTNEGFEEVLVIMIPEKEAKRKTPEQDEKSTPEIHPNFYNDLNNLLAAVLGNTQLLQTKVNSQQFVSASEVKEVLETVEKAVLESSRLVSEAQKEIYQPKSEIDTPLKTPLHFVSEPEKTALRILAVDDQEIIRDLLTSMLSTLGYKITVCSNGKEALEIFFSGREKFDLVITDLGMPDVSGFAVAKSIKERAPEVPIVLLTGWGLALEEEKLRDSGVDFVLSKPFKLEQLTEIIQKATSQVKLPAGS